MPRNRLQTTYLVNFDPKVRMNTRCSYITLLVACAVMQDTCGLSSDPTRSRHFVGFDLGTSGARVSVCESSGVGEGPPLKEIYTKAVSWDDTGKSGVSSYDDPDAWMDAVETLLEGAGEQGLLSSVESICISGTSASCLIVDVNQKKVTRQPRMYNYDVVASASETDDPLHSSKALERLNKFAPESHTARARTGSLAKLLTWHEEQDLNQNEVLCHQADYVSMRLMSTDEPGSNDWCVTSDWHNCLKLGFAVQDLEWPGWMGECLKSAGCHQNVLPKKVVSPGEPMGTISKDIATRFGLPESTSIVGGTTDSNAAFFAAAGSRPIMGTAVTSLGSTLAMKLLSRTYVEDASRGVYSHRFPSVFQNGNGAEGWLVGGASNAGCAVLRQQEFSNQELEVLSSEIDPTTTSDLAYYPLTKIGERFPVADSNKKPVLEPVPESRKEFLHGILQGIAIVERDGFQVLSDLGASPRCPSIVLTCGGGSRNDMWSKLRQDRLNRAFPSKKEAIEVRRAENTEAGYGAAILAAASFL